MRRLALCGVVVLYGLIGMGVYWMSSSANDPAVGARENALLKIVTRVRAGRTETIKIGTTEVDVNGKKTRIDFPGTDAKDVGVRLAPSFMIDNDPPDGTFWITIKAEQPVVLTKASYEKIQIGMEYSQFGEALGGVMAKGRMSDGFTSKLELMQGKRRFFLTFKDGKVTEKSAKYIE
jgi:hypothetical protein